MGLTGGRFINEAVRRRQGYIDRNGRNREVFMISCFLTASESELHLDRWPLSRLVNTCPFSSRVRLVFFH